MANERLYQFPSKVSPVPTDIIYLGDSSAAYDEKNSTIASIIAAYPNLSSIGNLSLIANTYIYSDAASTITAGSISPLAVSLLEETSVVDMQSTIGFTSTPTSSQFSGWDANVNLSANSFLSNYATTATAASTTTLTVASAYQQFFTGSTTQTVVLPITSTLVLGQSFYIVNQSSGVVTVQSSGANTIISMASNTTLNVTCILTSGTTDLSWYAAYSYQSPITLPVPVSSGGTGRITSTTAYGLIAAGTTATGVLQTISAGSSGQILQSGGASALPSWSTPTYPSTSGSSGTIIRSNGTNNLYSTSTFADTYTASTILYASGTNAVTGGTAATIAALFTLPTSQTFTSGSGTYTTPANCRYIIISMQGGGGGGGGSGNVATSPLAGGNGGNTTFAALTAIGGLGGAPSNGSGNGGSGGGASGGNLYNVPGQAGQSNSTLIAGQQTAGGIGGSSFLGMGGLFGKYAAAGNPGEGKGSGGQGGGMGTTNAPGCGGGSGGFIKHRINAPLSATYSYGIGAAGGAGAADTGGFQGGNGREGYILVEEYYI